MYSERRIRVGGFVVLHSRAAALAPRARSSPSHLVAPAAFVSSPLASLYSTGQILSTE